MAVAVSFVLLLAALYILFVDQANSDLDKAATGWIGVIIGYWLQ
jgi:hypothetical protein